MNFGDAIAALKEGKRVSRAGWNEKGMWLGLVPAKPWYAGPLADAAHPVAFVPQHPDGAPIARLSLLPWIGMRTVDACFVPWLASQTDMLAEDYMVVE